MGHALHLEEIGERSHKTRLLKGFSGVIEIISDYATNTYRAMYAIKLDDKIYVLHVFQKKSKIGIATPKREIEVINKRLQEAKKLSGEK